MNDKIHKIECEGYDMTKNRCHRIVFISGFKIDRVFSMKEGEELRIVYEAKKENVSSNL